MPSAGVASLRDAECSAKSLACLTPSAGAVRHWSETAISEQVLLELARLATAAGPASDRARDLLGVLRKMVPFDGAWLALTDRSGYLPLASLDLDASVLAYLGGPKTAHDIEVTGADRSGPPLSPSDLPYPARDLPTWAECLIPAGIHEGLGVALFEPGGRHVGFLALLSGSREPPTVATRERLATVTGLLAQATDPMRSLTTTSRLVDDAFSGALLFEDGRTDPLPGLPDDELLRMPSELVATVRARLFDGEAHTAFLWPRDSSADIPSYVRVTYLAVTGLPLLGIQGIVMLSSAKPLHKLTLRELEVLGMIVDGCSNQQIAHKLVVSMRTVAAHVEHILAKLSAPSRTHAAVRAEREGNYLPAASTGAK
ncbi:MAG: transcriptional regulator, LuxR family [Frankiales bacterium]|nr:transcriptional regulator, LuxR family [Frankiales bacterium]